MATNPRRWSDRLLLAANLAAASAAAGVWAAAFLAPRVLGGDAALAEQALGGRRGALVPLDTALAWLAFAAAVVLLGCNVLWLVRPRAAGQPSAWVVSETEAGAVRVARDAIEAALRSAGEALPEVTRVRVGIDQSQQKRLVVTAQFHCAEGEDHLAASKRLRRALAGRFAELVRIGEGRRVEVELEFQGFAGKPSRGALPREPEEEPAPFTGPKYPIDDDLGGSA